MQRAAMVLWLTEEAAECMVVDDGGLNPNLQDWRGASARPSAPPPPQPTGDARFLLNDTQELQQLGLLLAAWLLGPDADGPQWLSGRLSSLQGCASLQDLVGDLCGAVAEHVGRRFLVEAGVSAALVPAQDVAVGLMLRPRPGRVAALEDVSTKSDDAQLAELWPATTPLASSSALSGVVEDVGEYLQSAKNPCGDVCCLIEQVQQQQHGCGRDAPVSTGLMRSLVLLPLSALEDGVTLGLYLCFPLQLPGSLLEAVRESCAELLEMALLAPLRRMLRGPLAAEYDTLRSAVPGLYAVLHETSGEPGRDVVPPAGPILSAFATAEFRGTNAQESVTQASRQASMDEFDLFFMLPTPKVAAKPQPLLRHQPAPQMGSRLEGCQFEPAATATAAARVLRHAFNASISSELAGSMQSGGKGSGDAFALQTCPVDTRERQAELMTSTSSFIVVTGPDHTGCMRTRMDLLMGSVGASMGAAAVGGAGGRIAYPEDLEMLELGDELGRGGAGVVYRGRLATVEVAVKLMEVLPVSELGDAGSNRQAAEQQLRQRRELLRNAMEMVVQSNVSHPQIVQLYSVYRGVRKVEVDGRLHLRCGTGAGSVSSGAAAADAATGGDQGTTPHVTAIVCELCEMGSLGDMLGRRLFPHRLRSAHGRVGPVDMKGICMTLLDVALALRHLHSMNLVHRDVKPANLLLKSSPRDHRGFTVKLADFGFVLRLTHVAEDGSRYAVPDQACGTVTHIAPEGLPGTWKRPEGILMWEMLSGGVRPFAHTHPDHIPHSVCKGTRPTLGPEVPLWYRCLTQACWAADPRQRPTAHELVVALNGHLRDGAAAAATGSARGCR
ncbi:putative serine/threonine-protein kinase [Tetrabaena socialis]|uniref:Putative serine/threonine-protein kinase n=1 Tax=Tetrabaena socialis TaxID=47790 RepID=A0A2J8AJE3_9CHLO|nr:putative serine/threonine-protein kinase [Tetrabaena socialis]|eukprot:PNH12630.1 putative serine/threonine-protein kinase [Tetrabaena socialis]